MVGAVVLFGVLIGGLVVMFDGTRHGWQFEGVRMVPWAYGISIDDVPSK